MYISASQIDKYLLCPRQWGWEYLVGIKPQTSPACALGSKVHGILEDYFKKGRIPADEIWKSSEGVSYNVGAVALGMVHGKLPSPKKAEVEISFEKIINDITYVGRIDLRWFDEQSKIINIWDHKTSTDPSQWAKSEDCLNTDTQAILYSRCSLLDYPNAEHIVFGLNYGATNPSRSYKNKQINITLRSEEAISCFKKHVEPPALEMEHYYFETLTFDALKKEEYVLKYLEYNPSSCGVYGGCAHKQLCRLTAKDKIRSFFMSNEVIERLRQKSKQPTFQVMQDDQFAEESHLEGVIAEDYDYNPIVVPPSTAKRPAPLKARSAATVQAQSKPAPTPEAAKKEVILEKEIQVHRPLPSKKVTFEYTPDALKEPEIKRAPNGQTSEPKKQLVFPALNQGDEKIIKDFCEAAAAFLIMLVGKK